MKHTRTPPTPPKGTPTPRYVIRYWSDNARRWGVPGYRDHLLGHTGTDHHGKPLYFAPAREHMLGILADMRATDGERPAAQLVAITSKGLRVRIGGGAR